MAPARTENGVNSTVGSVFQFPENVAGEMLFHLAVSRDRLTGAGSRILIPIVPAAVAGAYASVLLNLPDEFESFHAIRSSAT